MKSYRLAQTWGPKATTISLMVAKNCIELEEFASAVKMYVRDEVVEGRSLVEMINHEHENRKRLSDFYLSLYDIYM